MVIDDFLSVFTLTSFCVRPNERSHVQSFGHTFGRTYDDCERKHKKGEKVLQTWANKFDFDGW